MSFQNYNQTSETKEYDLSSAFGKKDDDFQKETNNTQTEYGKKATTAYIDLLKKSKIFHICTLVENVPESRTLIADPDFRSVKNYLDNAQFLKVYSGLGILGFVIYLSYKEQQNLMLRLTFRPKIIGSIFKYFILPAWGTMQVLKIYERMNRQKLEEITSKYDLQNEDFAKITMDYLRSKGFSGQLQSENNR